MDVWMYAVDANFNFITDQTLGTTSDDIVVDFELEQNELQLLAYSNGTAEIDKTCTGYGNFDIWNLTISSILEVNPQTPATTLKYHPNPAQTEFNITQDTKQTTQIQVLDFKGALVNEWQLTSPSETFDVSQFSSGVYWLHFEKDGKQFSEKLVILR